MKTKLVKVEETSENEKKKKNTRTRKNVRMDHSMRTHAVHHWEFVRACEWACKQARTSEDAERRLRQFM